MMVKLYPITGDGIKVVIDEIFDDFKPAVKSKRVLIKPNMLGPYKPEKGVTTSPEIIRSVVERVESMEPKDIIVTDSPGGFFSSVQRAAEVSGIKEAASGHFRLMNDKDLINVPINSRIIPTLPLAKIFMDSEFFISLPRFKTHTLTTITGCIKNSFGIVMGSMKMTVHRSATNVNKFHEIMVDIYSIRAPDLSIMDAITVMEGNGPAHGPLRPLNMIIAGENGVEVDAVMTAMMGLRPDSIHMLAEARRRGLGEIDLKKIEIIGPFAPIPRFKTPSTTFSMLQAWGNVFAPLAAVVPILKRDKCIKCGQCVKNCPGQAIALDPYPKINRCKCIHCFCCAELCPEGALEVPSLGVDLLRRTFGS